MRPGCVSACIDHVTDGQTDGLSSKRGSQNMLVDDLFQYRISLWPKTAEKRGFLHLRNGPTDRRTDGRTDGPTDRPSYRDARTHLKT